MIVRGGRGGGGGGAAALARFRCLSRFGSVWLGDCIIFYFYQPISLFSLLGRSADNLTSDENGRRQELIQQKKKGGGGTRHGRAPTARRSNVLTLRRRSGAQAGAQAGRQALRQALTGSGRLSNLAEGKNSEKEGRQQQSTAPSAGDER